MSDFRYIRWSQVCFSRPPLRSPVDAAAVEVYVNGAPWWNDLEFEIASSDLRGVLLLIYSKIPITAVKMFIHL